MEDAYHCSLVMPAINILAKHMIGEEAEAEAKLASLSLSYSAVLRCQSTMSTK